MRPIFKLEAGALLPLPHRGEEEGGDFVQVQKKGRRGKKAVMEENSSQNVDGSKRSSVPVAMDVTLLLGSRTLAIGEEGRALANLLLEATKDAADESKKENGSLGTDPSLSMYLHKEIEVLHIGPHLLPPRKEEPLCRSEEERLAMEKVASVFRESSRAQVVVLEETSPTSLATPAWARVFKKLLVGEGIQSYKGAVVICIAANDEKRKTALLSGNYEKLGCKAAAWNYERWALGLKTPQLCQEPVQLPRISLAEITCAELLRPQNPYASLVEPVRKLFLRSLRGETFDDFASRSFQNKETWARIVDWRLWLLFERKGKEGEKEELGLCGFLIAGLYPGGSGSSRNTAKMRIERVAVLEDCRGLGYGERLSEACLEWTRRLSEPRRPALVSVDAFDEADIGVVPFYEKLGFRLKTENEDQEEEEEMCEGPEVHEGWPLTAEMEMRL